MTAPAGARGHARNGTRCGHGRLFCKACLFDIWGGGRQREGLDGAVPEPGSPAQTGARQVKKITGHK
eukprot:458237-Pelagomonas_calceolata.AAC.12